MKFEYKKEVLDVSDAQFEEILNQLGSDQWELCANSGNIFIFKRCLMISDEDTDATIEVSLDTSKGSLDMSEYDKDKVMLTQDEDTLIPEICKETITYSDDYQKMANLYIIEKFKDSSIDTNIFKCLCKCSVDKIIKEVGYLDLSKVDSSEYLLIVEDDLVSGSIKSCTKCNKDNIVLTKDSDLKDIRDKVKASMPFEYGSLFHSNEERLNFLMSRLVPDSVASEFRESDHNSDRYLFLLNDKYLCIKASFLKYSDLR